MSDQTPAALSAGPAAEGCLTPLTCGTSDTPDDLCSVCEERFEASGSRHGVLSVGVPNEADNLACLSPCPVAHGRAGLLCTCGNAIKRFDRAVGSKQQKASGDAHE